MLLLMMCLLMLMMCNQQLPAIMVEVKVVCALGKAFVIGTFFSGHAEKKDRDKVTMVSEHDANKGLSPAECDFIVEVNVHP